MDNKKLKKREMTTKVIELCENNNEDLNIEDLLKRGFSPEELVSDYHFNQQKVYQIANEWFDKNEIMHESLRPCSSMHDYSPTTPWNAPGMSIKDFI